MPTNTEGLQLLDQLPAVIKLQRTLLRQWCSEHGWTELQVGSDSKIYALPPGNSIPLPLPKKAFTQLERLGDIFHELRELQSSKQLTQKTAKLLIPLAISCAVLIGVNKILPSVINTSSQRVIVSMFFNYSIILLMMLFNASGSLALYGCYKQRKLRRELADKLPTGFLESMKGVDEGTLMRVITSSVTLVKE